MALVESPSMVQNSLACHSLLLSMANAVENGSQFFVTTVKTPRGKLMITLLLTSLVGWGRHVVFGKEGETRSHS